LYQELRTMQEIPGTLLQNNPTSEEMYTDLLPLFLPFNYV
jgi:hypothetical protein